MPAACLQPKRGASCACDLGVAERSEVGGIVLSSVGATLAVARALPSPRTGKGDRLRWMRSYHSTDLPGVHFLFARAKRKRTKRESTPKRGEEIEISATLPHLQIQGRHLKAALYLCGCGNCAFASSAPGGAKPQFPSCVGLFPPFSWTSKRKGIVTLPADRRGIVRTMGQPIGYDEDKEDLPPCGKSKNAAEAAPRLLLPPRSGGTLFPPGSGARRWQQNETFLPERGKNPLTIREKPI